MSQQMQLGKYEFYPYEKETSEDKRSLEELLYFLSAKATEKKKVRRPLLTASIGRRRRRRR